MCNSDMTAIILAAGQGTRLRPLTNEIPKCMVEAANKPLLHYQLDTLQSSNIENIVVVTGYKEDKIDDPRLTKVFNKDYACTNMVYSLFCADKYLKGDIIITYGDIIYSEEVLNTLIKDKRDIVIASDEAWQKYWEARCEDPLLDAETFQKGENGKVQSLGKKAKSTNEIEGQFIGMVKLSPKGVERFKEEFNKCKNDETSRKNAWGSGRDLNNAYMTDLLNHFATKGELFFNPIHRGWFEVDEPSDLKVFLNSLDDHANNFKI